MGKKHSKTLVDGGGKPPAAPASGTSSYSSVSSGSIAQTPPPPSKSNAPPPSKSNPPPPSKSTPFTPDKRLTEMGMASHSEPNLRKSTTGPGPGPATKKSEHHVRVKSTPSFQTIKSPPSASIAESSASVHQHPAINRKTISQSSSVGVESYCSDGSDCKSTADTLNFQSNQKAAAQRHQSQHQRQQSQVRNQRALSRNQPPATQPLPHRTQSQIRRRDPYNARLRTYAPPVYISSGGSRSQSGNGGNFCGMGPIDRLANVDVVEELCYHVPGDSKPPQAYDYYSINECGELEFVAEGPVCPTEATTNPVTYTKRQRFNFKQNQQSGDGDDGPPFAWPYDLNPCKCNCCRGGRGRDPKCGCECCSKGRARRAYYYDELPVGKNPDVKPEDIPASATATPSDHANNNVPHHHHSHSPDDDCSAAELIRKGKCGGLVPSNSGIYYFDAEKKQFFPHQNEVVVQAPPAPAQPPPPPTIECIEEIPEPVIQPIIIPSPCCGCSCGGARGGGMGMGGGCGGGGMGNFGMNQMGMGMSGGCCGMGMGNNNNSNPNANNMSGMNFGMGGGNCPCPMACPMPVMMMPGCPPQQQAPPPQMQMPFPFPFPKQKKHKHHKHHKKRKTRKPEPEPESDSDESVEVVTQETTVINIEQDDSEPEVREVTEYGDTFEEIVEESEVTTTADGGGADVLVEVDNDYNDEDVRRDSNEDVEVARVVR